MDNTERNTKTIFFTWIYAVALSPIFLLISLLIDKKFNTEYLLGFLLGTVVSLFSFSLIIKVVKNAMKKEKNEKVFLPFFLAYLVRYSLYGIVLYVAFESDNISWITTAIGFLSVKIVIILQGILKSEPFIK